MTESSAPANGPPEVVESTIDTVSVSMDAVSYECNGTASNHPVVRAQRGATTACICDTHARQRNPGATDNLQDGFGPVGHRLAGAIGGGIRLDN